MRHYDHMSALITAKQVAEILGKSPSQVNRDAAADRIPVAVNNPRLRLFDRERIEELAGEASK